MHNLLPVSYCKDTELAEVILNIFSNMCLSLWGDLILYRVEKLLSVPLVESYSDPCDKKLRVLYKVWDHLERFKHIHLHTAFFKIFAQCRRLQLGAVIIGIIPRNNTYFFHLDPPPELVHQAIRPIIFFFF